jgi:hypothetical protein
VVVDQVHELVYSSLRGLGSVMAGARQLLAGTELRFITRPTKSFYTQRRARGIHWGRSPGQRLTGNSRWRSTAGEAPSVTKNSTTMAWDKARSSLIASWEHRDERQVFVWASHSPEVRLHRRPRWRRRTRVGEK